MSPARFSRIQMGACAALLSAAFVLAPAPASAGKGKGRAFRTLLRLLWASENGGSSPAPTQTAPEPIKWPPEAGDIHELNEPLAVDLERDFSIAAGDWVRVKELEKKRLYAEAKAPDGTDLGEGWVSAKDWKKAVGQAKPVVGKTFEMRGDLPLSYRAEGVELGVGCSVKIEADPPPADKPGQLRVKSFGPDKREMGLSWVEPDALRQAAENKAAFSAGGSSGGGGLTTLGKILVGILVLSVAMGAIQGLRGK